MIKQVKDFLSKKGNGFLLWGLTISVFFLYSFNKSDLEKAWAGIVSLPTITHEVGVINKKLHEFDSVMIFRTNVLKRDIGKLDTVIANHNYELEKMNKCLNTVIRYSIHNKKSQDSIKQLITYGDRFSNNYSHNIKENEQKNEPINEDFPRFQNAFPDLH